ncbi:MAG: RNA polymerase sigma factor [Acidobacteriota bacterium]
MQRQTAGSRPDADLVPGLRSGEEWAFEELLRRFETRVYNLARSVTRSESDAQDVLQDTFLSVFRKVSTFKEESSLSTWIYRIAVNAALMKVRRRRHDDRSVPIEDCLPRYDETGRRIATLPDWPPRADDVLLRKELAAHLGEAIRDLEPGHRAVFVLRDQEGLSTEQVASVLELSVPAVKSRLHRARLFLRERIKEYWLGGAAGS